MLLHKELTDEILNAFYEVYNELGYGFLEKVYQNALFFELRERGLQVVPQRRCTVYYKGKQVGEYFTDIIVNELVILELKAAEYIAEEHELPLFNYLKASSIEIGLVLNFGKSQRSCERYSQMQVNILKNESAKICPIHVIRVPIVAVSVCYMSKVILFCNLFAGIYVLLNEIFIEAIPPISLKKRCASLIFIGNFSGLR